MLEIGRAGVRDHPKWVEVSPDFPCPICRATSACTMLEGGDEAHCFVVASDWPTPSGGWLHPYLDGVEMS
jgi:hypothetical protein